MTIVYVVSRVVMACQYSLLYFYARRKNYAASNQFIIQVATLLVSAGMWIGSYFMDNNTAEKIARFGLWYGGILIEALATIAIWVWCKVTAFRHTHIAEQFATLTLLILGEGVIGLCGSLATKYSPSSWIVPMSSGWCWLRNSSCKRHYHGLSHNLPPLDPLVFQLSRTNPFQRSPSVCVDLHPLSLPRCAHPGPSGLQFAHALRQHLESHRFSWNRPADDGVISSILFIRRRRVLQTCP